MKIYFATHSTSKDNEAGIASGWKDVELSELGVRQSIELGKRFKTVGFDLICCSDLRRAVDTVRIAFGSRVPLVIDDRLREVNFGDLNGSPEVAVDRIKHERIENPFPNGESYRQAVARVHQFFRELRAEHSEKTVLVVGHRATQFGLDTLIRGKTLEECLSESFEWQPFWVYEY